jgi:hypothetical protein
VQPSFHRHTGIEGEAMTVPKHIEVIAREIDPDAFVDVSRYGLTVRTAQQRKRDAAIDKAAAAHAALVAEGFAIVEVPKPVKPVCRACDGKGTVFDTTYDRAGVNQRCAKCFGTGKTQEEIRAMIEAAEKP